MAEKVKKILDTAVRLAEEGGFQGVRLRDVAARSGVSLGTVYTHFKSKGDLLLAAVQEQADALTHILELGPPPGATPRDRVTYFFTLTTRALLDRPKFARAVLRSLAAGEAETAEKVIAFHGQVTHLVVATARGVRPSDLQDANIEPRERKVGFLLQQIWFAALVGWMVGMHTEDSLVQHMREAAELLLPLR